MSIKEQVNTARNKNKLFADLIFNLRFLSENLSHFSNIPTQVTPQFKELSQEVLEAMDELHTQLEPAKKFIPSFSEPEETEHNGAKVA